MQPLTLSKSIALAWYDRAEWERLRDVSVDPQDLDPSFDAWEVEAVQFECDFRARGYDVRRAQVTADGLIAWCKARKLPLDRSARSRYASFLLSSGKVPGPG